MAKGKTIRASELRRMILQDLEKIWEKNPDQRAYAEINSVMNPIFQRLKSSPNQILKQGAMNSLLQDGL